jgi:hypothetical protein
MYKIKLLIMSHLGGRGARKCLGVNDLRGKRF